MTKKFRLLNILSIFVIVFALSTLCSFATISSSSEYAKVLGVSVSKDLNIDYTTYWKVKNNSGSYTLEDGSSSDFNVIYAYDSSTGKGTLTLNNMYAEYWGNGDGYIQLKTKYETEIVLKGNNSFIAKSGYEQLNGIYNKYGAFSGEYGNAGDILISGDGSLSIEATNGIVDGYDSNKLGKVTLNSGSLSINANCGNPCYGIKKCASFKQTGGKLSINVGNGSSQAYGIDSKGEIAFAGGKCDINITSTCGDSGGIIGVKGGSIGFGNVQSVTIVIDDGTTNRNCKLMNVAPTLTHDAVYSDKTDGSNATTILSTASDKSVLTSSQKRYFKTTGVTMYTVTYTDGVSGEEVFADRSFSVAANSATPVYNADGTNPTREGYSFEGWDPAIAATVTGDATYTAKWKKLHTILYTDGVDDAVVFADQKYTVKDGEEIPAFVGEIPAREGHEFKGWNPAFVSGTIASADATYTAQWEELYTVTYTDGFSYAADKAFSDNVHENLHAGDDMPAFVGNGNGTIPIKTDYKFTGWKDVSGNAPSEKVSKTVVYTAQWDKMDTTNDVVVLGQSVSLNQGGPYTSYWKAIDVEVESGGSKVTRTKLFPSDETDFNVSYSYNPLSGGTLTLKDLKSEHPFFGTPQAYVVTNTNEKVNLVLSGENELDYDKTGVVVDDAVVCYGKEVLGKKVVGELVVSGDGSLETTTNRYGIDMANGEGKLTVNGGTLKLHTIASGQGATGIRCLDYEQNGGTVKLDVQDNESGAAANCHGMYGKVTEPYTPGEFKQNGGSLDINVKTKAQAFGVIGFKKVTLADETETTITLDNGNNRSRLFGLGDDNQNQKCELVIGHDSTYSTKANPSADEKIGFESGDDTDVLQYLSTGSDDKGLNYYHKNDAIFTVTYTDGVEDEEIFADEVYKKVSGSATPACSAQATIARVGYKFDGWNPDVEQTVTKSATYTAKWDANSYTVRFNKNADDATGEMLDQSFDYDESKALTTNSYVREDYHFTGWKDASGNSYSDGQIVKNLASADATVVTLYAQWAENSKPIPPVETYSVTFDSDGGSEVPSQLVTQGGKAKQPADPSKDACEFVKWVDENGNVWDFNTNTVHKNTVLTAVWREQLLMLTAANNGATSIKLMFNKINGAESYVVYGNACGKTIKKLFKTKKFNYKLKSTKVMKLKSHKPYKYYVVALNKDGKVIKKSFTIHFITNKTYKNKFANVTKIKANKKNVKLAVGDTTKLSAKYKVYKNKKHLGINHGKPFRFASTDKSIVTVNKTSGKIVAVGKGTATVYIQDMGGKICKTNVTVF